MATSIKKSMLLLLAGICAGTAFAQDNTYSLPFEFEPDHATFKECIVIDLNNDGNGTNGTWSVQDNAFRFTYSSDASMPADDWIILPFVDCGTNSKVTVSISVKAGGYNENFELVLGQERTVEAMTVPVIKEENYKDPAYKTLTAEIELPEGDSNIWALGIHAYSDANMNTLDIKDISITGEAAEPPVADEYTLPFNFPATLDNFNRCVAFDLNGDRDPNDTQDYNFGIWSFTTGYGGAFKYAYNQANDANDWLILPLVDFGESTHVSVSVGVRTESDAESFKIFLGREQTPDAMTLEVLSRENYVHNTDFETISSEVKLPAENPQTDSKWCVGIHASSPAFRYNIFVNNVSVTGTTDTGVDSVNASESAETEYYNLQGIRLRDPSRGETVIIRRNGKIRKAVFN